ncbi:polynucleotide kinase-phosphatase [Spartinivicinus poritis]|uniref:Polynucleotide kinase-phosphatase n=1 Tax=Spartinivicinus poritis TaxID=2994640 RepID=A0ABT5UB41_9GAMM|nr:polynucleotide kinase-phosphatase [Spartinivicinus sp. A2-2]MDE1463585.1 polynucleotide kinase-phosphatase [Spartinivicinus sp. A2-2]
MTDSNLPKHTIEVPELSLVMLMGASGSGKSTFAKQHFLPTEVISSDFCRGLVANDENDQSASKEAFDVLHLIADKRLQRGLLTVIDATNVQAEARKSLLKIAKTNHCLPVAVVLNTPEKECHERNQSRPDRQFGPHVVRNQARQLRSSLKRLKKEGFRYTYVLSPEQIEKAQVKRMPLWTNKKYEQGPFDIIGDIHGCFDELLLLLEKLGYQINKTDNHELTYQVTAPVGRKVIFLGDLVDRGPNSNHVLRLVMDMVAQNTAICIPGNHENKLLRKLSGKNVNLSHGLAETMEQLAEETPEFIEKVKDFINSLVSHFVLDDGKLVVAHAGMKEAYQGRGSGTVRSFALYGETTGEKDEYGLPVRYNWAKDYRGKALVVYGHTPVPEAEFFNNTICLDTGCVFGGELTAMRYPEKELLSVPAKQVYYEPSKPLNPESSLSSQQQDDEVLNIEDVTGKRFIKTSIKNAICVEPYYAAAALEQLSRFTVHPKWLNYLPPTMSPCATSKLPELLEHPQEAFDYYESQGVLQVVCEEKHMGSRAIVQVCKTADVAEKRFGITSGEQGICYTRTGRRFFNDKQLETEFIQQVANSITQAGLWDELNTDWMTLDCELMPWSAKAMELIRQQYASVGSAANAIYPAMTETLKKAENRGLSVEVLLQKATVATENAKAFRESYQHYCWPVNGLADIKLAPFHVMATEGAVHSDKDHLWNMRLIKQLADNSNGLIQTTTYKVVDLTLPNDQQQAIDWWHNLVASGGEGIVVKPMEFICKGENDWVQPALKVRGPEYLRIIYGPNYSMPEHLYELKKRGLGKKRRLALREFALGIEALDRFVHKQPLREVHECIVGLVASTTEPVDPRL